MPFLITPTNNSHQLWDDFIKRAYDEQFEIFQVNFRAEWVVHIRTVPSLLQPAQMCTRTRTRTRELEACLETLRIEPTLAPYLSKMPFCLPSIQSLRIGYGG